MVGLAPHSRELCLSGSRLCLSLNAAWIGWDVLGHWRVGLLWSYWPGWDPQVSVAHVLYWCPYWLWPQGEDHRFIPGDSILSDSDSCSRLFFWTLSLPSVGWMFLPLILLDCFVPDSLGHTVVYGHSCSSHHYSDNDILHTPWYLYAYPDFILF